MTVEEFYEKINADYQDVIRRLVNKKVVDRIIVKFQDDPTFNELQQSIEQKDYDTAFRASHTLKGTSANLGFTKLYDSSNILTESLRHKVYDNLETEYQQVVNDYQEILTYLKEVKVD